jgi:hypothetical protein
MDVEDAVRYPLAGEDAAVTLLIGGGLLLLATLINFVAAILLFLFVGALLFPLALVPQVLVQGYLVRVLRSTVDGGAEPPVFDEWVDLGVDGLRLVLVAVVYSFPLVVVGVLLTAVFVGASVAAGGSDAGTASAVLILVTVVGGLLVLLLTLLVAYFAPVGLCAMVHENDVWAAFDVDRLRRVGLDRDYAVAWAIGAAVMVVGGTLAQMLFVLLVGFPIAFAAQVAGFRLFALGYVAALDLDTDEGTGANDRSTGPASPAGREDGSVHT